MRSGIYVREPDTSGTQMYSRRQKSCSWNYILVT